MQPIKNFRFLDQPPLGSGSFATVYLAEDIETGEKRAIKKINRKIINNPKLVQLLKSEIQIMKAVDSENVIRFYNFFETPDFYYIVMEFCKDGSLEARIKKKLLTEVEALHVIKQLLNGFKALHDQGIIHRDFKPANVLINGEECKICDLGFAKQGDLATTVLGTPLYMAPEVLDSKLAQKQYDNKIDIYSLGVSLYETVYGKAPFFGETKKDLLNAIKKNTADFESKPVSNDFIDLLKRMLKYAPEERISWLELYEHKLIRTWKQTNSILFGSLVKNLDASEIKLKANKKYYKHFNFKERENNEEDFLPENIEEGEGMGKINEMFARRAEKERKKEEERVREHAILKAKYIHQRNLISQMFVSIEEAMKILPAIEGNFIFIGQLLFAKSLLEILYESVDGKKDIFGNKQFHSFTTTNFFADYHRLIKKEKNMMDQFLVKELTILKLIELRKDAQTIVLGLIKKFSMNDYLELIRMYFSDFPNKELEKLDDCTKTRAFYKELIFLFDFFKHEEKFLLNEKNLEAFDFLGYRKALVLAPKKQSDLLALINEKKKELKI